MGHDATRRELRGELRMGCVGPHLCDTALNLCIGLIPLIDNFAHCGGFVVGLLRACARAEPSPPSGAARCF